MDDAPCLYDDRMEPTGDSIAPAEPPDGDLDLLRKWRDGDLDSGTELVRRYKAFIHRRCASLGIRTDEAIVDLFQEVVLGLAQELPTLPERIERSFAGWLGWRIRDAVTRRRRGLRVLAPLPEGGPADGSDPAEDAALREAIRHCADRLPPRENRVFALKYLGGLSLGEIAASVASNVNAVSQMLFRLSRRMRACLETAGYGAMRGHP